MVIKVKICGLTTKDAVQAAIDGEADYLGFVFYPKSPRNITPKKFATLVKNVPSDIKKVAVVVDATNDQLEQIIDAGKPDYIQCHGSETDQRVYDLHVKFGLPVIKAIAVASTDDVNGALTFADTADMLLFDTKVPSSSIPGGNGVVFDWTLLRSRGFKLPWFLSGGINNQNVQEAIEISGASYVDVSSSLESSPGIKDPDLIRFFLKRVHAL